ncbi:MAG: tRNA-intron lyase [Candidatus Hadarchaeales archaeon]
MEPPVKVKIYRDRGMVFEEAQANQLYQKGAFGKPLSGGKLQLSPLEVLYLVENGKAEAVDGKSGKPLGWEELCKRFSKLDPELVLKYAVYSDLRSRGYVVKTGLKFGAHFRVYDRGERPGEAHSKYLVHAIKEGIRLSPPELARAVRLAHSVRKTMLFAVVDDEGDVTYYSLRREKP